MAVGACDDGEPLAGVAEMRTTQSADGVTPRPTGTIGHVDVGGGGGLFVYQSGVYVLGYSYGCFDSKDFLKVGLLLTLVQAVGLALLVPFYWPLIGLNWSK